jgi:DNA polymerase III delta prime subunit
MFDKKRKENSMRTIVVNLFAGPGAGKTTCAWEIAAELKKRNINTEYASEYAKELVWDERMDLLDGSTKNQRILIEEQNRRIERLQGKVSVVVTDSPILLGLMYQKSPDQELDRWVMSKFEEYNNFNLFIQRGKVFEQSGRIHNLLESKVIDDSIKTYLKERNIFFGTYTHKRMDVVIDNICFSLKYNKSFKERPEHNSLKDALNQLEINERGSPSQECMER